MEPLSLIIYHNDPGIAHSLMVGLSQQFGPVTVVQEHKEVRSAIAWHRAQVLVLDLESSCIDEIGHLHQEFPSLSIVATHRLADDELWTEAMNQGAADICEPRKDEVVRSVRRSRTRHAAA
jgi:DNA-binding NtrC family response regulator